MAQGSVRAFHFSAGKSSPASRLIKRHVVFCAREGDVSNARHARGLVPTSVVPALYVTGAGQSGQSLAGTGALVWEGEVVGRTPARPLPVRSH